MTLMSCLQISTGLAECCADGIHSLGLFETVVKAILQSAKMSQTLRHLREDSLALKYNLSTAELSRQFGPTNIVPKCLESEVSGYHKSK